MPRTASLGEGIMMRMSDRFENRPRRPRRLGVRRRHRDANFASLPRAMSASRLLFFAAMVRSEDSMSTRWMQASCSCRTSAACLSPNVPPLMTDLSQCWSRSLSAALAVGWTGINAGEKEEKIEGGMR